MKKKPVKNLSLSIQQKLLAIARASRKDPNRIFQQFAVERFLYRLAKSKFNEDLILKGGYLLNIWHEDFRPTKDIDFLGIERLSVSKLKTIVISICSVKGLNDGISFDGTTLRITGVIPKFHNPRHS